MPSHIQPCAPTWCDRGSLLHVAAVGAGLILAASASWAQPAPREHPGRPIYRDHCLQCHGAEGDGHGDAFDATFPKPRDFTSGLFKFRTTDSGEHPTLGNLQRIIAEGMPGTSMPAWAQVLGPQRIAQVAAYVQGFYVQGGAPPPVERQVPPAPPPTREAIARGRLLYERLECARCHGRAGRGDGNSAMTLKEDWTGGPIYPRDLTAGWRFRGGRRPEDLYRTILFGLNGTPMPAHNEEKALAQEQARWDLVHYLRSLGPDTEPEVKSTLVARRVDGEIPLDPDHALWERAEPFYVPLAAQVIVEPRLFQPSVRYLLVRALHNAAEIGLRVEWVDPTSRDNEALREALRKAEQDGRRRPGDPLPVDELAIQFPLRHAARGDLPYFLMGRPGQPVRLWVWRSDAAEVIRAEALRFGAWRALADAAGLTSRLVYQDGLYVLTLKRPRITDAPAGIQFPSEPGMVPISFSVADGFKGEGGARRAIATWYTLMLERPPEARLFILPLLVAALVGAAEMLVLRRTRARARRGTPGEPREEAAT
ncbi:MAG: c-type cytochrome [Candidatus Lambdaproteobacteria bacterium]|nr:c-type cytochrome [Candidatus Lambdaproteobacteria bacterium]